MDSMEKIELMQVLSNRCVDTYISADIIEHLEEEALELGLAWKRVSREREKLPSFLEEIIDVMIECNTVLTLLQREGLITEEEVGDMLETKLMKFKAMLDRDQLQPGETKKNRYKGLPKNGQ